MKIEITLTCASNESEMTATNPRTSPVRGFLLSDANGFTNLPVMLSTIINTSDQNTVTIHSKSDNRPMSKMRNS
ncbi:Uncharacterised protein [Yersinia similis]|uniref:Uncharacterized protein n=1 Tax=Yersinia similis TaxID=367190 RepID=A0A0T9R8C0_9GAMM|nr:Uncharacterised protein [Yersinia similis]CNC22677.1 Uncharacterised protein [Yersinia similis]CNI49755.1 Uncharacterised protein [Yersinia similis]